MTRTIVVLALVGLAGLTMGRWRFRGARWLRAISGAGLIYLFVWFMWGNLLFMIPASRRFYMACPAVAFLLPPFFPAAWYGFSTLRNRR